MSINPVGLLFVSLAMCSLAVVSAAEKPNFVIINVDDLGFADIGPYGSDNNTPHLDRMAREGRKLTSHYAAPVCSPSRASLMTGCYPKRALPIPHVLFPSAAVGLHSDEITIAEVLKDVGYKTACIGKWHLGDQPEFLPTRQGFDYYYGIPYSNDMGPVTDGSKSNFGQIIPKARRNEKVKPNGEPSETGLTGNSQPPLPLVENETVIERLRGPEQETITKRYTEHAIEFIRENKAEPFFLYLPHNAVHFPLYPREEFRGKSPNGLIGDWAEEIDWSVGQVLDTLRELKLDERTLVIFTSDNGGATNFGSNNKPLRGAKAQTFEGGIRTCTLAWWPGQIPAGTSTRAMTSMMDVLPTFASLAGAKLAPDRKIDGVDVWPVLSGDEINDSSEGPRQLFFYFRGFAMEAIRKGPWKLHFEGNQLFNLDDDIGESSNVAAAHPQIVASLREAALTTESDLGLKQIGPGCRPLGRITSPRPLIGNDGKVREDMAAVRADVSRPNVVVFLADDAGWGDYSRNGNTQVSTPNIDSIAAEGVTLDRFYVCPVCAPTRAEFLTGRYHSRTGVYGVSTGQERIDFDEKTIADAFKAAGYATGAFGKWHNGSQWPYHPMARGFDEYYGYTSGHWGEYFDPPLEHNGKPVRAKGYIVDACTNQAIDFIDRNHAKPFFCYVPFTTPHSPWAVPEEDWVRFKNKPINQFSSTPKQDVIAHTRCALAMLENQDRNVGRVLARLEELDIADNTIVLYFSDNGPNTARFNGGMKGRKGGTDEGGVRSTCFLRWKAGLPANTTMTNISGAIDLMPTLTALAGVPQVSKKPIDGLNLTPWLRDEAKGVIDRAIFSTWNQKVSVRTQTHRLDHDGILFDMVKDPGQTTPLGNDSWELGVELRAAVASWKAEVLGADSTRQKKAGRDPSVDPRSIPVGYSEFPRTWLPARDGNPVGQVKRSSSAPNSSYFVNWKSTEDRLIWDIQVHTTGLYKVEIEYTCAKSDEGATIEVEFNGSRIEGSVMPAWDPPLYINQDTIPRPPAESPSKEFRSLQLGKMALTQGAGPLTVRALKVAGNEVMHLSSINLTLVEPE